MCWLLAVFVHCCLSLGVISFVSSLTVITFVAACIGLLHGMIVQDGVACWA